LSPTQDQKAEAFRALHEGEAFVIPNPWDAGSARVLESLGFKALATTSGGFAFTLGRRDGEVTLDEVADHAGVLDQATGIPVSVELENGYGPDPEQAASAVTRVAAAGAVGGSIEDYDPAGKIYGIDHTVERVSAAADPAPPVRGVGGRRSGAVGIPRGAAHVRQPDDRGRRQREGAEQLPRPREHRDHVRPLRAPNAGQRGEARNRLNAYLARERGIS
jgi:Phosphoenolpyruvate phosphomutase